MFLQKTSSDSSYLLSHSPSKVGCKFQSPKTEKCEVIELTIDLSNPSREIIESTSTKRNPSDLNLLLQRVSLTPEPRKRPQEQEVFGVSMIKSMDRKNCKTNTHENPRKILNEHQNKLFFTEPGGYNSPHNDNKLRAKMHHITNTIYSLDQEIKAHTKATLDQNFSTAFTPNSKQTEEDFESQAICEANYWNSRKNTKVANFFDPGDNSCLITELSRNVKYVNGGVGVNAFEEFMENNGKASFTGISLEENPKKNQVKTPFSPVLMDTTSRKNKNQDQRGRNTNNNNEKFLEVFTSLLKKLK